MAMRTTGTPGFMGAPSQPQRSRHRVADRPVAPDTALQQGAQHREAAAAAVLVAVGGVGERGARLDAEPPQRLGLPPAPLTNDLVGGLSPRTYVLPSPVHHLRGLGRQPTRGAVHLLDGGTDLFRDP
jgi:hypothetical protein